MLHTGVRVDVATEWWRCCVLQTGVRVDINTVITTIQQRSAVCCRQGKGGHQHCDQDHRMVEVLCVADRSKDEHQHCDHDHPTAECCVLQTGVKVDISTVIRTTQ